jgi:hypothetical protein
LDRCVGVCVSRGFGEAEIQNLGSVRRQENVPGLDVAVDDAGAMSGAQRASHGDRDVDPCLQIDPAACKALLQRFALQQLHDEIRVTVANIADVVKGADVRMLEGGDRAGFALEAVSRLGGLGDIRGQHLDGDVAIEPRVARLVDLAHAARADRGDDLVRSQACTSRECHRI